MTRTFGRIVMAIALLTLSAGLCLSKPNTKKPVNVTISQVTTMPDGAQLKPGTYRMELLNDATTPQVAFYQNGKLLCKCPVKLENAQGEVKYTKMLYDVSPDGTRKLNTIEVAGWEQTLVFSSPGASNGGM